ncbi:MULTISPECIES: MarR family winged helix-turn-helix transcriptional regulator [unclassified Plantibacter]|uniref:MarR family winged helix-turn-helix transcriptional regulator n=1 Tax=unclassified Plantibacter TaxID=2624265 RepID=UPI003D32DCAA
MSTESEAIDNWREMQRVYLSTSSMLDRALQDGFQLGLSEFEVLDLVAVAQGEDCTMRDLVAETPMTQSALSRVVDRLQKSGMVERSECTFDRRSLFVGITRKGRDVHAEAKRAYEALLASQLAGVSVPASASAGN